MHTADRETDGVVTLQSVGGGAAAGGFSETLVPDLISHLKTLHGRTRRYFRSTSRGGVEKLRQVGS